MEKNIYMVEFKIPDFPDEEFISTIPNQRAKVHEFLINEVILSYSLAHDRSKLWVQIKAASESELLHYIESLPLTKYLDYQYTELMFVEALPIKLNFSLN